MNDESTTPDNEQEPRPRRRKGVNLGITQELKVLKIDPSMTPEQRALVEQIEHMREQTKAHGSSTEVIDEYVKEELAPELKAENFPENLKE